MTGVMIMGLLLLKHGLLAHVIDFGYSASRRPDRFWYVAMFFHCTAELVGSLYVLRSVPLDLILPALLVEVSCLSLTTLMERDVPLSQLLIRHLCCEAFMILVYGAIVFVLLGR